RFTLAPLHPEINRLTANDNQTPSALGECGKYLLGVVPGEQLILVAHSAKLGMPLCQVDCGPLGAHQRIFCAELSRAFRTRSQITSIEQARCLLFLCTG